MEPARHTVAAAPEPADIIARARALIPTLAERSREARRLRRIPDETIADMQRAGFFRVLQPKRWGGYEMDLHTFYDVELALGEGDMSTAWIYGVSGVHPWFMALLDDRAAQEVWGEDTSVLICSSLMPAGQATAVDGGYRLSGRWRYASCCVHCDWPCSARSSQALTAKRPRAASSSCRARTIPASTRGKCPACRPPEAGTSS